MNQYMTMFWQCIDGYKKWKKDHWLIAASYYLNQAVAQEAA